MLELDREANGDLVSPTLRALAGRKLDLLRSGPDSVHPVQALIASWRRSSANLTRLLHELDALEEWARTNEGTGDGAVTETFRQFIYDATETFDVFKLKFPAALREGRSKTERREIDVTVKVVHRLRDLAAVLCNKLKHENRQIMPGRIESELTGMRTFVYSVQRYKGGTALVRDEEVHPGSASFRSYRSAVHEILHGLLRADANLGMLIGRLSDNGGSALPALTGKLNLTEALTIIGSRPVLLGDPEPLAFDAVDVSPAVVRLVRSHGVRIPDPTRRTINLQADGMTSRFSFI